MVRDFKSEDEGKRVLTADGKMVGRVERVSGSSAHVEPDEDLSRSVRRRLGWTEEGRDTYRLRKANVDSITDDEIRLAEE
jgi:hypothetical protein